MLKQILRRSSQTAVATALLAFVGWTFSAPSRTVATAPPALAAPAASHFDIGAPLLAVNTAENTLSVIHPLCLEVLARIPTGAGPSEAAVSEDGQTVFVVNSGTPQNPIGTLSIIDIASREEVRRVALDGLRDPRGAVQAGGKIYFSAEGGRTLARYDPEMERVDWSVASGQRGARTLTLSPNRRALYAANSGSNTVTVIDIGATPQGTTPKTTHIRVGKRPEALDVSPDGRELWVGHAGGTLSIIDTATQQVKESVAVGGAPGRLKFTLDGRFVLVTDRERSALLILDAASRQEVKRVTFMGQPSSLLVARDGRRAFVCSGSTKKDLRSVRRLFEVDLESMKVTGLLATPSGLNALALPEASPSNA